LPLRSSVNFFQLNGCLTESQTVRFNKSASLPEKLQRLCHQQDNQDRLAPSMQGVMGDKSEIGELFTISEKFFGILDIEEKQVIQIYGRITPPTSIARS